MLALTGCGGGEIVSSSGDARAFNAGATAGPSAIAPPTTVLGMQGDSGPGEVDISEMGGPGSMIPISNDDGTLQGYQRWEDVWGEPGRPPAAITRVTDDNGKVIGYNGQGVGWITLQEFNAPGFSLERAQLAYRQRLAAVTGCPVETVTQCMSLKASASASEPPAK